MFFVSVIGTFIIEAVLFNIGYDHDTWQFWAIFLTYAVSTYGWMHMYYKSKEDK